MKYGQSSSPWVKKTEEKIKAREAELRQKEEELERLRNDIKKQANSEKIVVNSSKVNKSKAIEVNDVERSDSADRREHQAQKKIEISENKTRNKSALHQRPSTQSNKNKIDAIN